MKGDLSYRRNPGGDRLRQGDDAGFDVVLR
jgi:hypothetical protein